MMQQSAAPTRTHLTVALHDGRAGNARQALALAHALDLHAAELVLQPRAPWRWLAPRVLPGAQHGLGPAFHARYQAAPQLAIGCGRQAALASRLLRTRGAHAVQILNPRIDPAHWDIVITPQHDRLAGSNVVHTLGSLHPVDDDWLLRAIPVFPSLAMLPTPHSVLLVGGPTRAAALDDAGFAALLQHLSARARAEGGSFSAIASRRTPPTWRAAMGAVDVRVPGLRWRDTGDGANPYAGLLANADRLICTPDSVNMLSEAAATHAPLFVWQHKRVQGRSRRFIEALLTSGRVRALDETMAEFAATPLRETERVATQIRQRLQLAT